MSTPVTKHFTVEEFACKDGTAYPVNGTDDDPGDWLHERLLPLCQSLEVIREAAGDLPLIIDSGYRTIAYDTRLYNASAKNGLVAPPQGSLHPKGKAADITHSKLSPSELHTLVGQLIANGKLPLIGGMGLYPNFLHVDVREKPDSGHVAQWGADRLSNIA